MGRISDLRASLDWQKMIGETIIVVVGVFLGIQASNWNDERLERAETSQVLRGLKPELTSMIENFRSLYAYYETTRAYGTTAFAGWRNDSTISDRDFVIAAYQASQNSWTGINGGSWSAIFGSDRLRNLEDQELREELAALMTTDFGVIEKEIFSEYRENVRKVIPEDIQDAIRDQCGDRRVGTLGFVTLPKNCALELSEERYAIAARELRGHPELVGQLRWHFAAVATYLSNIRNLERIATGVLKRIEQV